MMSVQESIKAVEMLAATMDNVELCSGIENRVMRVMENWRKDVMSPDDISAARAMAVYITEYNRRLKEFFPK